MSLTLPLKEMLRKSAIGGVWNSNGVTQWLVILGNKGSARVKYFRILKKKTTTTNKSSGAEVRTGESTANGIYHWSFLATGVALEWITSEY